MKREYRFRHRKNRKIEVLFSGSEKWVSSGADDEEVAMVWAESNKYLYMSGRRRDPYLKDFAKDFWTRRDRGSIWHTNQLRKKFIKEDHYRISQGRVDNYIIPALGTYRLSQITPYMVDQWFLNLTKKDGSGDLSDNSKNKILLCLSQIFDEAIRTEICFSNPCEKVRPITEEQTERLPMDDLEMRKLFPKEDKQVLWIWGGLMWACYFSIMKCTGWRPGEIAGLRIDGYYKNLSGIYTASSVDTQEKKLQDSIKTSKSGKKFKVGLLDAQTIRLLDEYIETIKDEDRELLFLVNGNLMTTFTSNKHFKGSLKRAEIPLKGRTQYSLRHTFQTKIAGEVEREKLQDLMGHTGYRQEYDHRAGIRKLEQLQSIRDVIENIV
jgi:integrase